MINQTEEILIGEGRSGKVYLEHGPKGRSLAKKVFTGEGLGKIVLFILTGSANPYTWCEPAVRAAVARRYILKHLVSYWFNDRLRLPDTDAWSWNKEQSAFEIRAEMINGTHAPLPSPFSDNRDDYLHDLVENIMRPLQDRLIEAGFDGLVWQAGLGNPVASNNFMLEKDGKGSLRWVWIDLESGVPALFALNPFATLLFYLPRSVRHRRPLFDDVDILKFRSYLLRNETDIKHSLNEDDYNELTFNLDQLDDNQRRWKSLSRRQRSIAYEHSKGKLSDLQAANFKRQPLRWNLHLLGVRIPKVVSIITVLVKLSINKVRRIDVKQVTLNTWHYIISATYRWGIAQAYVGKKIDSWSERGFIVDKEAEYLKKALREDDVSSYLTDFSVHLAIKLPIKIIQWLVMPALWALGIINGATFALVAIFGGSIGRTIYTLSRLFQSIIQRQRKPWVALFVGAIQGVGTIAYPLQLIYRGTERSGELARFIVYDSLASIGRKVPIWGGRDSRVEHFFVSIGAQTVSWLGYLSKNRSSFKRSLLIGLFIPGSLLIYFLNKLL